MYEMRGGTKRLAAALYSIADDRQAVERLAYYLHYRPGQLTEDIQALNDYIREAEQRAAEGGHDAEDNTRT